MNDPVKASFTVSGSSREEVFAAIVDVGRFPEWGLGLKEARTLDPPGAPLSPGTTIEFVLSAAGITHHVKSMVIAVEPPRLLEWRYTQGAIGRGGWVLEDAGGAVEMTLFTSYQVKPRLLDRLANRPFFRGLVEDLLRRSMRRFEDRLNKPPAGR